jgi:hypothetical protein
VPTERQSSYFRFVGVMMATLERHAVETEGMSREQMMARYIARGRHPLEVLLTVDSLMECRDKVLARRAARDGRRPTHECIATLTSEELLRYAYANSFALCAHVNAFRRELTEAAEEARAACGAAHAIEVDDLSTVEQAKLLLAWEKGWNRRGRDAVLRGSWN